MTDNTEGKKHELKKDRFHKARGGTSSFFNLFCANCQQWLLLYQKDGPGTLYRLYLDRIHAPENLAELTEKYTVQTVKNVPPLKCSSCNALIAAAMVYQLESRLAYRLKRGAFSKQKSNGTIPPPAPQADKKE